MKVTTPKPKLLQDLLILKATLQQYHPLVIEGHTKDIRNPSIVASRIVQNLQTRWNSQKMTKPVLLISQGDPLKERGISAITRNVGVELGIKRFLVCLDEDIFPPHTKNADRHDVIYETKYSLMVDMIRNHHDETFIHNIEEAVDKELYLKNKRSMEQNQQPLADWYRDFALLQEVTKTAVKIAAGEFTLAHTVDDMEEFSVTSFYSVGVELGLYEKDDILPYF
uniref:Shikimate kinase n=1 Tax=Ditylum brightwellii TaxID=49249 RepID=A0A7S1YP48_9STRA|mmetsp:Transcript_10995/g.16365  ORF Transcript_10995/g.16365 Transcript_10995/m.16365 type:complete len:224 (+) Transcript_10995:109-780(+)